MSNNKEVELVKCLDKKGEVKYIAPAVANNPNRMKSLEYTLFPVIERPNLKAKKITKEEEESALLAVMEAEEAERLAKETKTTK